MKERHCSIAEVQLGPEDGIHSSWGNMMYYSLWWTVSGTRRSEPLGIHTSTVQCQNLDLEHTTPVGVHGAFKVGPVSTQGHVELGTSWNDALVGRWCDNFGS